MPKSTMPRTRMKETSAIDEMAKAYEAMLPKEFGGAMNLFIHPMAGAAAMSAIGFGVASHAFGLWMGTVAGAAEASRRAFETASEAKNPVAKPKRASKPRLELVRSNETAGQAGAMMRTAAAEAERVSAEMAVTARQIADEATQEARKAAETAERMLEKVAKPQAKASGPSKPKAMTKPATVDDLKAISGIGPKLEQVLNKLGIWTYAQIADFGEGEIAWLDEELGFAGRIGRDDWTGQARKLAGRE